MKVILAFVIGWFTILNAQPLLSKDSKVIEELKNEIKKLNIKVMEVESKLNSKSNRNRGVNLNSDEVSSSYSLEKSRHFFDREWFNRIDISGFGAAGYTGTGSDGAKRLGAFINYEASLFVDAAVWDGVNYFHEINTVRLGNELTSSNIITGEVYVGLKDVLNTLFGVDGTGIGMKVGRLDIPFGEEYLTQDVVDNPLITFSAAYPYGIDEGFVLYGKTKGVGWILSLMDGRISRAADENADKFVSLKIYGNLTKRLYLSASGFRNGRTSFSAWQYGGTFFYPVGSLGGASTLGISPSRTVDAYSYELDARVGDKDQKYLKVQYGATRIRDGEAGFDRDLMYFQAEPKWTFGPRLGRQWFLVGRVSGFGTFDKEEGYAAQGKIFAGGFSSFGFDTSSLVRYAVGFGLKPNPNLLIKIEYSVDDFKVINSSAFDDSNEQREFIGILFAAKF